MGAAEFEYEISTSLWRFFLRLSQVNLNNRISSICQKCDYTVKKAKNTRRKVRYGISVRETLSTRFFRFFERKFCHMAYFPIDPHARSSYRNPTVMKSDRWFTPHHKSKLNLALQNGATSSAKDMKATELLRIKQCSHFFGAPCI